MTAREARIYTAARQSATDSELCLIEGLTVDQLEKYRKLIDRARAEGAVAARFASRRRPAELGE